MKVWQALWTPQANLELWAERATDIGWVEHQPFTVDEEAVSQFFCEHHELLDAFELMGLNDPPCSFLELSLPSCYGHPLSSPLLRRKQEDQLISLQPWLVPSLTLDPLSTAMFLTGMPSALPDSFVLDKSVSFWVECSKLLLELLTRGSFLPSLSAVPLGKSMIETSDFNSGQLLGGYQSRWEIICSEKKDKERLDYLARSMPPICLSLLDKHLPVSAEPRELILSFIRECGDCLIRRFLRSSVLSLSTRRPVRSTKEQVVRDWLTGLGSQQNILANSNHELIELAEKLDRWKERIVPRREAPKFTLGFRLLSADVQKESGDTVAQAIDSLDQAEVREEWQLEFFLSVDTMHEQHISAADIWTGKATGPQLEGLDLEEVFLTELAKARALSPLLKKALLIADPSSIQLTTAEAYTFLSVDSILLQEKGCKVLLPWWWEKDQYPVSLHLDIHPDNGHSTSSSFSPSLLGLNSLVNFSWKVSLGNETLSLEQFEKIISKNVPLLNVGGEWIVLAKKGTMEAAAFLREQSNQSKVPLLQALRWGLGAEESLTGLPVKSVSATGWIAELLNREEPRSFVATPPLSFQGTLRPYQIEGLSWLVFLSHLGIGGCLADDMGLGKTIQLLAFLAYSKEREEATSRLPCLLFAPMSVIDNWEKEAKNFVPDLKVYMHHGSHRLTGMEFVEAAQSCELVVTTYALGYRDADLLGQIPWRTIVLDEAQFIKNWGSRQSQAIRRLSRLRHPQASSSAFLLALTGTPLENHLDELWSIIDFVNPGYLGGLSRFRELYSVPIERYRDADALQKLTRLVSPIIMRRIKTNPLVIADLPEKIEMEVSTTLTAEQTMLYQKVLQSMLAHIDASEGLHRKGLVLALITRLKQICDHPALFLHEQDLSPTRSGKLQYLEETLDVILAEGDKVLIFTQFAQMGQILKTRLQQSLADEVLFLHGSLPKKARVEIIEKFQTQKRPQVFVLSLKAGGFGLNLTQATQVIHYDQWWNPAVHEQATDRAYRIGQDRVVQVRRLISKGTLEERIMEMLKGKRQLADTIVQQTKAVISEMSTSELRALLTLDGLAS